MRALILGGERHGEWIDTLDGSRMWVDIHHAARHVLRKLTWNITDAKGIVIEAYEMHVAVHEQLMGPDEPMVAQQLLQTIVMNEYARKHGERQEIPHEPAGSSLVVPPTAP